MSFSPNRLQPAAEGTADAHAARLQADCPALSDTVAFNVLAMLCDIVDGSADCAGKLSRALECLSRQLGMTRGAITLLAPDTRDIHIEIAYGLKPAEQSRGRYRPGEGVTGMVIQSGRGIVVPDVSREPRFLNRTRARNLQRDRIAFFCVPLKINDEVIGALSVECGSTSQRQEVRILQIARIAASLLAPYALQHQQGLQHMQDHPAKNGQSKIAAGRLRPSSMIGTTAAMQIVFAQIAQVAPSNTTVLIRGESGTGKELVARAIHDCSPRAGHPFVSLNCAALPEGLIESELFGHEKGAFTGASSSRKGRFELAQGGTLFLDEVGDMSLLTQAKLLRVIQEKSFERLGAMETRKVDVRILAATNRNLEDMVERGTFRRDLYYRLNVFPIMLPPLRERKNDILLLANHFLEQFAAENEKKGVRLSLSVMDMLHRYDWPGNIRELENVIERAVLLVETDGLILPQHLPPDLQQGNGHAAGGQASIVADADGQKAGFSLQKRVEELERTCIVAALRQSGGHIGRAAENLDLTERVMALRMRKYGIRYQDYRGRE